MESVRIVNEMKALDIHVSMISDYTDLLAASQLYESVERKWLESIALARVFETDKLRIFCGNKGSEVATESEWELSIARLRHMADRSSAYGIYTVIETHPGTFADCLDATLRLVHEVEHDYVRINLDFLHLWEAGCHPLHAYEQLKPWTINYHLKNVADRSMLPVFSPSHVYSPHGEREGITSLAEGQMDYDEIIHLLNRNQTPHSASLEWFGNEPFRYLKKERQWLYGIEKQMKESIHHIQI